LTAVIRQVSYSTHAPLRVAVVALGAWISFTQQYILQQTDALRLGPKQRQRTLGGGHLRCVPNGLCFTRIKSKVPDHEHFGYVADGNDVTSLYLDKRVRA